MAKGAGTLGRPKRGETPPHKNSSNVPEGLERVTIMNLKGTKAFYNFLSEVSTKTGIPRATVIRLALREYCENHGHGTPPPI